MTAPDTTRQAEAVKPDPLSVGATLANVAFNFAQKAGYTLTSDDCAMLDKLRKQWDESRRAAVSAQDMGDEYRLAPYPITDELARTEFLYHGKPLPTSVMAGVYHSIVRQCSKIQAGSASRAEPVAYLSEQWHPSGQITFDEGTYIPVVTIRDPTGWDGFRNAKPLYTAPQPTNAAMPAQQADSDAARLDWIDSKSSEIGTKEVFAMLDPLQFIRPAIDAAMSPKGGEG